MFSVKGLRLLQFKASEFKAKRNKNGQMEIGSTESKEGKDMNPERVELF